MLAAATPAACRLASRSARAAGDGRGTPVGGALGTRVGLLFPYGAAGGGAAIPGARGGGL